MRSTESESETVTKLKRIRWLSQIDSGKVFHNLMHLFNEDSLRECFKELDGKKAVGTNGIDKEKYRENLDENLKELVARMKRMAYRPGPVRQVLISKPGKRHENRPLGTCNFEDKIVQKMMQKVLESIYDPLFLNASYGIQIRTRVSRCRQSLTATSLSEECSDNYRYRFRQFFRHNRSWRD